MQTAGPPQRAVVDYSAEIAMTICSRLINRESLRAICADPAMPAKATVCRWLARNAKFRDQYALARDFRRNASPTQCSRSSRIAVTYLTPAAALAPSSWWRPYDTQKVWQTLITAKGD